MSASTPTTQGSGAPTPSPTPPPPNPRTPTPNSAPGSGRSSVLDAATQQIQLPKGMTLIQGKLSWKCCVSQCTLFILPYYPKLATLGRVLPYLGMVGRFQCDDPCHWDFLSKWVPILCLVMSWLSLSHLFPEIHGPKVGLIFHQNVFLTVFKPFVSIFSLIFDLFDTLLHWS